MKKTALLAGSIGTVGLGTTGTADASSAGSTENADRKVQHDYSRDDIMSADTMSRPVPGRGWRRTT